MIGRVGYLLGNILSSVIGRIWVDWPSMGLPIFPNPCFGPNKSGLCSGCYRGIRAWHGPHCSFGLASGMLGPVLYPHQLPPSPCVRTEWARAVINPATVVISTCLLRYGLIKLDRRHTWYVNDGPLGFALVFHTPLVLSGFLPTSPVLSSKDPWFLFQGCVVCDLALSEHEQEQRSKDAGPTGRCRQQAPRTSRSNTGQYERSGSTPPRQPTPDRGVRTAYQTNAASTRDATNPGRL